MKRVLSVLVLVIMLITTITSLPIVSEAVDYTPENGAFVFTSTELMSHFKGAHNLNVEYAPVDKAVKLTVSGNTANCDPYVLFDIEEFVSLKAAGFSSMIVVYNVPTDVSSSAYRTEFFINAGDVLGPTAGKSAYYTLTKSENYVSKEISLSSLSWWKGDVHSIRIDPFSNCQPGDTFYLDSIILCPDSTYAQTAANARLSEKNTVADDPSDPYNVRDLMLREYDVTKYASPFWKGDIVYHEAVFPIKDKNGNTTYPLMYTPDKIVSVFNATNSVKYQEGRDYTIEGNKITFITTGKIKIHSYTYLHPTKDMIPAGYNDWSPYYYHHAAGDGLYDYHTADIASQYINVSYVHSDTWQGPVPEDKSSQIPRTASAITNKSTLRVVYYGDSICGGARASSYQNLAPYAEWWNQQITSKLQKDLGVNVIDTISSVGGSDATTMSSSTNIAKYVTPSRPDLVFIEFGVNDAQNAFVGGTSKSTHKSKYKSAVISIINQIRANTPNTEFVLITPFYSNIYDFSKEYIDACRDALYEIEATTKGCAVADVTEMHSYLLYDLGKNYVDFSGDNLCHPNDYMSRVYSQVCLETIVPGGIEPFMANPHVHEFGEWTEKTPAGCVIPGISHRVCECGEEETAPIPPVGHTYSYGECVRCGEPDKNFVSGDVNTDGNVNAIDANILIKNLSGQVDFTESEFERADINKDKTINAIDANLMKKKLTGIE